MEIVSTYNNHAIIDILILTFYFLQAVSNKSANELSSNYADCLILKLNTMQIFIKCAGNCWLMFDFTINKMKLSILYINKENSAECLPFCCTNN